MPERRRNDIAQMRVELAWLHGRDCLDDPPSQRHLAGAFGLSRAKVAALVGTLNGQHPQEHEADAPDQTP